MSQETWMMSDKEQERLVVMILYERGEIPVKGAA